MPKPKISFNDIKIGDMVLTTNNKIGEVIALKSYAYLNDKFEKKANKFEQASEINDEGQKFKFDNSRHNGIWYSTVTIAVEDPTSEQPSYYIENLDFIEIREILKQSPKSKSIMNKLENIFKI